MTDSMEQVVQGYLKIQSELPPSTDPVIADCIFHDIANYNIPDELSEDVIREELTKQFLSHPFTQTIMGEIDNVEDIVFSQPMSTAAAVADAILSIARGEQTEVTMPASSGKLVTLSYLFPRLRRYVRPKLYAKGRKNKDKYRNRNA